MRRSSGVDLAHRAHQRGLAGQLAAHQRPTLELRDAGLHAFDLDFQGELVAGFHGPLEARAVNGREMFGVNSGGTFFAMADAEQARDNF